MSPVDKQRGAKGGLNSIHGSHRYGVGVTGHHGTCRSLHLYTLSNPTGDRSGNVCGSLLLLFFYTKTTRLELRAFFTRRPCFLFLKNQEGLDGSYLPKCSELRTFFVRSSFPSFLSCSQEEPHRELQVWLGEGWSLALDAQPGSPQVPEEVARVGKSQDGVIKVTS